MFRTCLSLVVDYNQTFVTACWTEICWRFQRCGPSSVWKKYGSGTSSCEPFARARGNGRCELWPAFAAILRHSKCCLVSKSGRYGAAGQMSQHEVQTEIHFPSSRLKFSFRFSYTIPSWVNERRFGSFSLQSELDVSIKPTVVKGCIMQ